MPQGLGPLRLYDTQRSGNAWKVRLLAGFIACPLERRTLSIDRGDLRTPEFAAVSRFRQVPVLELGNGGTIVESAAILFFLAQGTAWWPDDPGQQTFWHGCLSSNRLTCIRWRNCDCIAPFIRIGRSIRAKWRSGITGLARLWLSLRRI
ncbi:glutathione S-transferase N-terminal domain-containing protein [Mesorhizobium caraganae]|uniref:glutathione S-transferase N-terminal domain-containing protein n=1 Tax=Mesorhizobium caraganae TaxID=483206 RepID=UPI001784335C|nr:glutathione S-transferase N-terminal domain-containing protein [Mesorhizobium caraganae]